MMQSWQQFFRHPMAWINIGLAILLNAAMWGVLLTNITPQPDLIVLHYTLYFGVNLVGKWTESLYIPGFGLLLIVLNTIFAHYFFKRSHVISYFFLVLLPIYEILLLFATIFLIIANVPASF